jgi:hypothetical protein
LKTIKEEMELTKKQIKLIQSTANLFSMRTGISRDELESEAYYIYTLCLLEYDETKGAAFDSYLYTMLRTRLINFVHEYYKQIPQYEQIDSSEMAPISDTKISILKELEFREWLNTLSPSAKSVVALLDNCADEICSMHSSKVKRMHEPKHLRGSLRKFLITLGWGKQSIDKAFNELRLAIDNI